MTRVKLCGMFRDEDIPAVVDAAPDLCGFVVEVPSSPRSVSVERLVELCSLMDAIESAEAARSRIGRVGVFVNAPIPYVARAAEAAGLDLVQLHGNENRPYIDALRGRLPRGVRIIQAFRPRVPADAVRIEESHADLVLLDAGQGSGTAFDWSLAAPVTRPFLLAGGLAPETLAEAIREVSPWGVDMSSGIETDGVKDPEKMKAAVAAARGRSV
ncbi:MAG: phosphoribosylanthranilate isomerase [Coriobacteriaceae bacterium]|nr:phosphoribosylanthranilate isomerase [Coriobacteriaceae bacterium]